MAGRTIARKGDEGSAYWMLGGLYEVLVTGEETDGELTQMRMTTPQGVGAPPHRHPGGETLQVIDGEIEVHIEDDVVEAGPGSSFHFPAGTLEWWETRSSRATVIATYFPGGIDKFFGEVGEPALTRDVPPPSDEEPDFERIISIGQQHGLQIEGPPA